MIDLMRCRSLEWIVVCQWQWLSFVRLMASIRSIIHYHTITSIASSICVACMYHHCHMICHTIMTHAYEWSFDSLVGDIHSFIHSFIRTIIGLIMRHHTTTTMSMSMICLVLLAAIIGIVMADPCPGISIITFINHYIISYHINHTYIYILTTYHSQTLHELNCNQRYVW